MVDEFDVLTTHAVMEHRALFSHWGRMSIVANQQFSSSALFPIPMF